MYRANRTRSGAQYSPTTRCSYRRGAGEAGIQRRLDADTKSLADSRAIGVSSRYKNEYEERGQTLESSCIISLPFFLRQWQARSTVTSAYQRKALSRAFQYWQRVLKQDHKTFMLQVVQGTEYVTPVKSDVHAALVDGFLENHQHGYVSNIGDISIGYSMRLDQYNVLRIMSRDVDAQQRAPLEEHIPMIVLNTSGLSYSSFATDY